ncbi:MAG: hypothetical protein ACI9NN_000855, partial [Bacteroidia bacterium]
MFDKNLRMKAQLLSTLLACSIFQGNAQKAPIDFESAGNCADWT